MIQKIIWLLLFFIPALSNAQELSCSKFKEGRFIIYDYKAGAITIADRNSTYQTEYCEALKLKLRFRISWQSNCSYTLQLDKVLLNENKISIPSNLNIQIKIINTKTDSYIQEITSSIINGSYNVTVSKIK